MKRSNRNTPTTSYYKKPQLDQDDHDISNTLSSFKEKLKEQLLRLTQSGLSPRKAYNVIFKRLISSYTDIHDHETIQQIQYIQSILGGSIEEALNTFLINSEIIKLKTLGFSSSAAINELINRLIESNNLIEEKTEDSEESKVHPKRKSYNDNITGIKKMKVIETDDVDIDDTPKEPSYQSFNPFQPKFTDKASRIDYFLNNKLQFSNDKDSSASDEEYSSSDMPTQEDELLFMYDDLLHNTMLLDNVLYSGPRRYHSRRRQSHRPPLSDFNPIRDSSVYIRPLEIENRPVSVQQQFFRLRNELEDLENVSSQFSSDSEVTHRDGFSFS